jgi:hypothetical protein
MLARRPCNTILRLNDLRLPNRGARRRAKHAVANADKAAARRRAEDAVANADKALVEAQAALDKASVDRRTGGDCSTSRGSNRDG